MGVRAKTMQGRNFSDPKYLINNFDEHTIVNV
jgi:hypothetical protein